MLNISNITPSHKYLFLVATLLVLPVTGLASDDEWNFRLSPYLFAATMEGDVGTLPPLPPAEVDMSFSDIWDNLDMGLMGFAEARKGRFGLFADLLYMDLSADGDTPRGVLFSEFDVEFTLSHLALGGSYELTQANDYELNALAGVFFWDVDNKLKLEAGAFPGLVPGMSISEDKSWNDVFLGLKGKADINDKWYVNGWGMAAVDGDSDSAWEVYGGVGYNYSDSTAIVGGYRHMELDYDKGSILFDVEFSGPAIGVTFLF